MTFTLTRAQVRDLDRRAMDEYGLPGLVLMENAGRGCAELLMRLNPEKRPTVILCGPGNNGGDGFVMARHLDNAGWPVCVSAADSQVTADAKVNRIVAEKCDLLIPPRRGAIVPGAWVVDALYGTGLNRAIGASHDATIAAYNASDHPILAIDIPSGLDCDTGEPLGPCVRATHTATFVAPKRGFLNPNSREWTGKVHVIDIGAPRKLVDEYRS